MDIFHQDGSLLANLSSGDFALLKTVLQAESLNDRDRFIDESAIDLLEDQKIAPQFIAALREKMKAVMDYPSTWEEDFNPDNPEGSDLDDADEFSENLDLGSDPVKTDAPEFGIPGFEIFWEN